MSDAGALHRQMFAAVRDRDFARLRELYHPDYVYMSSDGVEHKGADAGVAVARASTTAFPDLSFEIPHQWNSGDNASIIEFVGRGTHRADLEGLPPTGKRVEVVVCNVVEVQDGKIYRERQYFDALTMMNQLV